MTNDLINLRSDMSPVTNDLARVAAGRVLGPGQTVIWNTNTAGEIQWNRDGTFSVQISPRGDEENLGEILWIFIGLSLCMMKVSTVYLVKGNIYKGKENVNKWESQVGLGEHEHGR